MTDVFEELRWRNLVYDHTEGLREQLANPQVTAYVGFDPTSDSLQVGNLLALMGLARLQRYGHTPIAVAGGGTGMIGDPSGKATERQLLSLDQVRSNVEAIRGQLERLLDFQVRTNPARIVNNADWLTRLSLMEFLRDIGKHFTVNYMVAKDSVKSRLEHEEGISYTEFSYMLLQAYDFLHLFDHHGCTVQAGGSDQWGNITAGVELIRRMRGARAFGLVFPLVTSNSGTKLGKTEQGTVWLDANRTSPYRFYQFWLNQEDADVIPYLGYFTWLERAELDALAATVADRPEERQAQRRLAQEVTRLVHGEPALARAEKAAGVLFGGDLAGLGAEDIAEILADVPSSQVSRVALQGDGLALVDLLVQTEICRTKGEARRLVEGGGVYLNNRRAADASQFVTASDAVDGQYLVLRKGKRSFHLVRLVG